MPHLARVDNPRPASGGSDMVRLMPSLLAASKGGAALLGDDGVVAVTLAGDVRSLAASPTLPSTVFAGTQGDGVWRSDDGGRIWRRAGLSGCIVKSLAVAADGTVVAGTKPVGLFRSRDLGESWTECRSLATMRRWYWYQPAEKPHTSYVQSVAMPHDDPEVIVAAIEGFRLLRSEDGGVTWRRLRHGVPLDCHKVFFHPTDTSRAYVAAGLGAGWSRDRGATWARLKVGLDRRYAIAGAADPMDPDRWYLGGASMLKAHSANSHAAIYRAVDGHWQQCSGGLPATLEHLPMGIVCHEPGVVVVGLRDGTLWRSGDAGDSWATLPTRFDGLWALAALGA